MPPGPSPFDRPATLVLRAGAAIPLIYYGIQLAVAPFYPGYDFVTEVASMLGSDRSPGAPFFNAGIVLLGLLTLAAAPAALHALRRLGRPVLLAVPLPLAMLVVGLQSLWAAAYPLPDPRHGGHPIFVASMVATPFLAAATLWTVGGRLLRAFLVGCALVIAAMAPVMSGRTALDPHAIGGLAQRVLAFPVFVPMGVAAFVLGTRLRGLVDGAPHTDRDLPPPSGE